MDIVSIPILRVGVQHAEKQAETIVISFNSHTARGSSTIMVVWFMVHMKVSIPILRVGVQRSINIYKIKMIKVSIPILRVGVQYGKS